jgi:uncharacterized protein with ParB-like and HNH nuclease domain
MDNKVILEPKLVGSIEGNFIIPEYQRGYRWQSEHITMLLNDIWENGNANYSLQPVVVKKLNDGTLELIDGQQRLTSIFLIMKYIKQLLPSIEIKFSIKYVTRPRCEEFLISLDSNLSTDNIDFLHIYNAYQAIEFWFDDKKTDKMLKAINIYKYFGEKVKVIWFELEQKSNEEENKKESIDLFTRLNIGKIPLTNAELVKALFLSRDSGGISEEKQLEIATSWDIIEKELHDRSFWAFLTNEKPEKFSTRIELIFNMMADKSENEKEKFFTFFYFTNRMASESKLEIWKEIQAFYLILKEWYDKSDIYHKVGYLIATGEKMQKLINESKKMTKSDFEASLNDKIVNSLNLTRDKILELSYKNNGDRSVIEKILLLFNVETVRLLKNSTEKYSFDQHKRKAWSLEHIHAQNSEGLNKKEDQQLWLKLHRNSLENLKKISNNAEKIDAVIQKIDEQYVNITKVAFDLIFAEVFELLSENSDRSYMDMISNMALLSVADNAALNNSTFDVKRNKILEMDKNGEYIPICTRRVFLKYYTESQNNQLQFWGENDRESYLDAMIGDNGTVTTYLIQTNNNG